MKPLSTSYRFCFLVQRRLLLLSLMVIAPALIAAPTPQKPPIVILVVSGSDALEPTRNVDAVLMVDNGKLRAPYAEESEAAQQKFAAAYFAIAKKYRVTFGGGEVGTATIKGHNVGCNNIHATATFENSGRIPGHLSALATDSEALGRKPSSRRAPTEAERAAVMKLVQQVYRSRGSTPALLKTLRTTNLTATDLDGDGKSELIGSFVIETKSKARKDLLLIAEPQGNGYKSSFVNFQAYKLAPEGFDSAIDFVDQLDVDGDGIGEVFTTQHGFDAYGYNIYKKVNGRWREALRTIGDAC